MTGVDRTAAVARMTTTMAAAATADKAVTVVAIRGEDQVEDRSSLEVQATRTGPVGPGVLRLGEAMGLGEEAVRTAEKRTTLAPQGAEHALVPEGHKQHPLRHPVPRQCGS